MQSESQPTDGIGTELLSDAKGVGASAINRVHSEVDSRKSEAATQAKSVSSAIGQAASGLDDNAPDWLKGALEQGAQQIQKFADTLENKDSRQLVSDIGDFARTSPAVFLGACAAAGFAAARVFKAGGTTTMSSRPAAAASPYQTSTPSEAAISREASISAGPREGHLG